MIRRAVFCLTLFGLVGCQGSDILKPGSSPQSSPAFKISDGAHIGSGANPDFFFLPPMVKNPNKSPNWNAGAFNGNLTPFVDICEVDATTETAVNGGAACKTTGYTLHAAASVSLGDEQYQLNWTVPVSSNVFYRIMVHAGNVVTTKLLGIADVETASNASQLKNVNADQFVTLVDGQTLPIKFRIERYALCEVPGVGPCTSAVVNLAGGGTVTTTLPGGTAPSGVTVPPQSPTAPAVTITVQSCPSLNPRAIDLPVFGPCVRVTADPPLPPSGLTTAATVFVCDIGASITIGGNVVSADQKERITLHRLDVDGFGQHVTALPHATACGGPTAAAGASVKGFFASLAHGRWKSASGHLLGLIGPKSLYAARRIDGGGGGDSEDFSDFQFALPAKMEKDPATDSQTALPGATLPFDPAVIVTDLAGEKVRGATVKFFTATDGSVAPLSALTDTYGRAHAAWTLKTASGPSSLRAYGRGIAGPDSSGPRAGVDDPFQPVQMHFDNTNVGAGPVTVRTGSQTFTATGVVLEEGFEAGIPAGWTLLGTGGTSAGVPNVVPTQGIKFAFIATEPGIETAEFGGHGGTTLKSSAFFAAAGDVLSLDFNFLTNDGTTGFKDFTFVQLLNASDALVATVANGNTTGPYAQAIPALDGSPPPVLSGGVTLAPSTKFFDGVLTGPLGGVTYGTGKYGGGNGGATGFVHSTFTIPTTGTFKLLFVVQDFGNRNYVSALVIDHISVQRP